MSDITILVASLGKNLELANTLKGLAEAQNVSAEILNLVELDLPLYSAKTAEAGTPEAVTKLVADLVPVKKMIFVAPEYNGLMPPVLNNAIAWASTVGDDWREVFNGKVSALATHSGGGGLHALMAMRQQLSYIGMTVLGRQLCTNFSKPLSEKSANAVIKELVALG